MTTFCKLSELYTLRLTHKEDKEAIYYINTSVLRENTQLVHAKPHPGLGWPIFHILTCKDIDDFSDIMFDPLTVLLFVGVRSKHLRIFLESLLQFSVVVGNLWENSVTLCELRRVLGNLRKSPKMFGYL